MNHLISNEEVNIEWERIALEENHGSGCTFYHLHGEGDNGKTYVATGIYQNDDLIEIEEIEEIEEA